jgi:hypothetical protein
VTGSSWSEQVKRPFDEAAYRRDLLKLIARCEQTIHDCDLRAQHRPDQPTIDTEWFKTMLPKAQACLAALDAGDREAFTAAVVEVAQANKNLIWPPGPVARQDEP